MVNRKNYTLICAVVGLGTCLGGASTLYHTEVVQGEVIDKKPLENRAEIDLKVETKQGEYNFLVRQCRGELGYVPLWQVDRDVNKDSSVNVKLYGRGAC